MFQHCLICTDFSDGLQRFTRFVEALAQTGLTRIVFLHTVSVWEDEHIVCIDESKLNVAKEQLSSSLVNIPTGVEVKVEVSSQRYLDHIQQVIERDAIDLIITGMAIRSNLESKIFGSHTLAIAKATEIPILVLRPQLISTYTTEELTLRCQHLWQHLLIPYDDSPAANYLLTRLKQRFKESPHLTVKSCRLLWVVEDMARQPELMAERMRQAEQKLGQIKIELEGFGLKVTTDVRSGNPLKQVLDVAFVEDISAITIANYRSNLLDWAVNSLADNILVQSWFPVLFYSPRR